MCCIWSMLLTLQRHRDQKGRGQIRQSILGYQRGGGRIVCLKQFEVGLYCCLCSKFGVGLYCCCLQPVSSFDSSGGYLHGKQKLSKSLKLLKPLKLLQHYAAILLCLVLSTASHTHATSRLAAQRTGRRVSLTTCSGKTGSSGKTIMLQCGQMYTNTEKLQ